MKRRSGFQIMKRLIVELKPLAPIMGITISMGVVGFLAAIAIASFAAIGVGAFIGDLAIEENWTIQTKIKKQQNRSFHLK